MARKKPDGKVFIPKVPRYDIERLAEKIKPVFNFPKDGKRYIKPVNLFAMSFMHNPEKAGPATDITPLMDIETYHTHAFETAFKPTVAEVLAQINQLSESQRSHVVAFEIIDYPKTVDDLNKSRGTSSHGFHRAKTRLYTRAK